jgi:hypothetical protein
MTKKIVLLLLSIISCNAIFAQYTSKLDNHSSVVFPSKPQEMNQDGQVILYGMMDKENKVTGMATVIDVTQYGVDSNAVAANYNNSMFVDIILQNVAGQFTGAELVSKKKVAVGKLMGYDVVFKNHNPTEAVPYENIYAHVMFAGSHIYTLSILDVPGTDGLVFTDKFFSSLKVD